jgi:hypothetical protein
LISQASLCVGCERATLLPRRHRHHATTTPPPCRHHAATTPLKHKHLPFFVFAFFFFFSSFFFFSAAPWQGLDVSQTKPSQRTSRAVVTIPLLACSTRE